MSAAQKHTAGNGKSSHSLDRDALRTAIFNSPASKPKSEVIEFFGQKIEIRQPLWGDVLDDAPSADVDSVDSKRRASVMALIRWAFIPGTDEKVFEEGDMESLLGMPFGAELTRVFNTLNRLSDVNPTEKSSGSEGISGSSQL